MTKPRAPKEPEKAWRIPLDPDEAIAGVPPPPDKKKDKGQHVLVEYALILALVAIIAITALIFLGGQISRILYSIAAQI